MASGAVIPVILHISELLADVAATRVADFISVAASGILEKSLYAISAQLILALAIPGTGRVEPDNVRSSVAVAKVWGLKEIASTKSNKDK